MPPPTHQYPMWPNPLPERMKAKPGQEFPDLPFELMPHPLDNYIDTKPPAKREDQLLRRFEQATVEVPKLPLPLRVQKHTSIT